MSDVTYWLGELEDGSIVVYYRNDDTERAIASPRFCGLLREQRARYWARRRNYTLEDRPMDCYT